MRIRGIGPMVDMRVCASSLFDVKMGREATGCLLGVSTPHVHGVRKRRAGPREAELGKRKYVLLTDLRVLRPPDMSDVV